MNLSRPQRPAPLRRHDAKEAVVARLGDDLVGADGRADDAGAGERDAQRERGGGEGGGLHLCWVGTD
jgi:hypothetical protein